MLDINSLLLLIKVAELGSFTAAARALDLPKSLVSARIARLEDELGVRLLQRSTRRVSLTDEGHRVLEMASAISEHVDQIVDFAEQRGDAPRGLLRITAPHDLGIYVIQKILPAFLRQNPGVQVEVDLSSRYVDLVEEGFDVALRAAQGPLRDSSWVATRLLDTDPGLYAHRDYSRHRPLPRTVAELADHPVILYRPSAERNRVRLELIRENTTESVEVDGPVRSNDMLACKHAVLGGLGIGLLPGFAVAPEVGAGDLIRVLPEWKAATASFFAVRPSRKHVPPKTRCFLEALSTHFAGKICC